MSYKNKETLKQLYLEEELSTTKIGNKFDKDSKTIWYWLDKYDIDRRSRSESRTIQEQKKPLKVNLNQEGYQTVHDQYGQSRGEDTSYVLLHRLIKLADTSMDDLDGMIVHHKNNIPFDNRPENLEIMTPEEHTKHHEQKRREMQFLKQTINA